MGLAARARKLFLSRGTGGPTVDGVVWSSPDPEFAEIDPDDLPEGARLVQDFTITCYEPVMSGHIALTRDRVTSNAGDFGFVYAWDGALIGHVVEGRGTVLNFEWPDAMPCERPGFERPRQVGGDLDPANVAARRLAEEKRIAAELADAERAARASRPAAPSRVSRKNR